MPRGRFLLAAPLECRRQGRLDLRGQEFPLEGSEGSGGGRLWQWRRSVRLAGAAGEGGAAARLHRKLLFC
jgi:hypothetical protein